MPINQERSKRKASGGRLVDYRKAKKYSRGSQPILTKIGEKAVKVVRTLGGNQKIRTRFNDTINVIDPQTKKAKMAKMVSVVENTANPNFVRRNIYTKGAIVQTDLGSVRITSRPGQDGSLNGVLVPKQE